MTNTDHTQPAEHTKEPWFIDGLAENQTQVWIRNLDYPITSIRFGKTPDTDKANARRLTAAVNACKGIPIEALEQGVVAKLRHILGELLTAAETLDAVLVGTAEEGFDAERRRLNAACRTAQALLDDGMEIDLHDLLAAQCVIGHLWGTEDVQEVRPDLDEREAWKVLQAIRQRLDSQYGMNYDTIEFIADELYGPASESEKEEEQA